jgi:endo-1,4-beta-xylanase
LEPLTASLRRSHASCQEPNPSNQDNTGINTNFEDGGLDGCSGRAGSVVTNSTVAAHAPGTHSLVTTDRTQNYDGPQINVRNKMYNGSQYNITAWVMLVPTDNSSHTINISLQATLNGNTSFPSITPYPGITVPADGQWYQISVHGFNMSNVYDPGT